MVLSARLITIMTGALTALTLLFGLQLLRVLFPLLVYAVGIEAGASAFAGIFVIFASPLLAIPLRRWIKPDYLLLGVAGGVGFLRLLVQAWVGSAMIELGLVGLGVIFFFLFWPVWWHQIHLKNHQDLVTGILLGLLLDGFFHGAFRTLDLTWRTGIWELVLLLGLVLGQWILLVMWTGGEISREPIPPVSPNFTISFGPFLFLQLIVFLNLARLTTLTGWAQPVAFGWLLVCHLAGLVVSAQQWVRSHVGVVVCGVLLLGSVAAVSRPGTLLVALGWLVGQCSLAALITFLAGRRIKGNLVFEPPFAMHNKTTYFYGLSMVMLLLLVLFRYGRYGLAISFPAGTWTVVAALIVVGVLLRVGEFVARPGRPYAALLALPLLILPLLQWQSWKVPTTMQGSGLPVRVMTFNIHNGFDTEGHLALEELAQLIEESGANVIALQEVSRGWVVNGSVDTLTWLSQRLDMPYVFDPMIDPLLGMAILSRYPILETETIDLPPADLAVNRGALRVTLAVGNGETLDVISTHFHHLLLGGPVREVQSRAILDLWGGADSTVIVGDFNTPPNTPPIDVLRQGGLTDAYERVGQPDNSHTFYLNHRPVRIDYIWLSRDLNAYDLAVSHSNASDHYAVSATIGR